MNIFEGLIDDKTLRVLKLFVGHPEELFHISKAAEASGVPTATTFRIINSLLDNDILSITKIGKMKVYRLSDNTKTEKLRKIL